jgi:hypothetical protein
MLKSISAALLAVSVLAAPAFAAGLDKTTQSPKTTTQAPAGKTAQMKPGVLNAKAKMGHHHFRHHHFHKRLSALKTHRSSKVSMKHVTAAPKRG